MLVENVTVANLQKMLDRCAQSEPGKHGYLGYKKVTLAGEGEKTYLDAFSSKSELEEAEYQKVSIAGIHNITHYVLSKNTESPAPNKILKSLHKISENRNQKLNSLVKKVGRIFLSVLKYFLYFSVFGAPLGLMIRNKQSQWSRVQAETNRFLQATSSVDGELDSLVEGWNSEKTRRRLQKLVSQGISEDLEKFLPEDEVKSIVTPKGKSPLILRAFKRDHSRGCSAKYTLVDEETGFSQSINPLAPKEKKSEHFKDLVRKIGAFNEQGNLAEYSPYVQALLCQNILQSFLYKQKIELLSGAWKTEDSQRVITPGKNPCIVDLADMKIMIGKSNGSHQRIVHIEGTVNIHAEVCSIRAIDADAKGQLDFEEPAYHYTSKISFDLYPRNGDGHPFSIKDFKLHTTPTTSFATPNLS